MPLGDKMKRKKIVPIIAFILVAAVAAGIYFSFIKTRQYSNADFGIKTYKSSVDKDSDGIDDQTDILKNVREYIATNPKYKSQYYAGGWPDDEYGVCTDVVAQGLLHAGYNLQTLVDNDIKARPSAYDIDKPDSNIDFRRVRNLLVYFKKTATELTLDVSKIAEWQGGDIVVFKGHIGIVSDRRNKNGTPYVIHHANPFQLNYEEDILERRDDIVGHFRIS